MKQPNATVELFCVAASHPVMAAELMLRHKGIRYRKRELPIGWARGILRLRGFPDKTVPALLVDGQRIQGTRVISRWLDGAMAGPPLFPRDAGRRAQVEAAEAFGEQLQNAARRIELWGLARRPEAARTQLAESTLPIPTSIALALTPASVGYLRRVHGA